MTRRLSERNDRHASNEAYRHCAQCERRLPLSASPRRHYCSTRCRMAASRGRGLASIWTITLNPRIRAMVRHALSEEAWAPPGIPGWRWQEIRRGCATWTSEEVRHVCRAYPHLRRALRFELVEVYRDDDD